MRKHLAIAALAAGAALWAAPAAFADNDQTVVLGFGLGMHRFAETDDVRKSGVFFSSDADTAAMGDLFVEWYALGQLGFGLRAMALVATGSAPFAGSNIDSEVAVSALLLTVNWVPIGSTGYARLGLFAGTGPAEYKYTATFGSSSNSVSSDGSASAVGIYGDWGGDGFGARFGATYLSTDLSDLDLAAPAKVDGTGTSVYFALRWAFS